MAAAECGEWGGPPPLDLVRAWRIERWGDPFGGGWYDWPAGWLTRMTTALNVYNAFDSFSRVGGGGVGKWRENNPSYAQVWDKVMELRVKNGYYRTTAKNSN